MAKRGSKKPSKKFRPGERDYCEGQAGENVEGVPAELESLRVTLSMYPQAFEHVIRQVNDLPYSPKQANLDAFVAFKLGRILDGFADRMRQIGVRDVEDPDAWMQHVDLSAGKDFPDDIDHEAVRQSALNQSGDADGPSTASTDEDVAKSAEVADDRAIRDSLGVEEVNKAMDGIQSADVDQMMASLGVGGDLTEDESGEDEDDDEEEDGGNEGGGSERVQLDMLDSEGTQGDPALCAQRAARFLYRAVVRGYGKEGEGKPGLYERMRPLVEYGVLTRKQVVELLQGLVRKSEHIDFNHSIDRYRE